MIKFPKHWLYSMILAWCFASANYADAQIVMTPSAGCAPLSVQFSGPAGATGISWNLGGGTTQLSSPSHLFSSPGNYLITYSATLNGNPVSYSAQLVVSAPPSGSFSFTVPTTRCKPVSVTFKGSGGAPGSTYQWAFGDLTALGSGASVSHIYVSAGSFIPMMIIVDAVSSCTALAANQSGQVNVSDPAALVIKADPGFSACNSSLTANISGSASTSGSPLGGGLSSWSWTFNAGAPSSGSGVSPGQVTFLQGIHTINVSATDNNNCTTKASSVVSVVQPSLSVPAQYTTCIGEKAYFLLSSTESHLYLTQPGGTATLVPPYTQLYVNNPGLNTYTVTASPPYPCAAITQTFGIFAEQILVDFTTTPQTSCGNSVTATYSANVNINTSSILSYSWSTYASGYNVATPTLGSGSPSMTFTFSQNNSGNQYTIYKTFEPEVSLVVKSQYCRVEIGKATGILIQRPTAWFYTDANEGCSPLTVTFRDSSRSLLPPYPITGYTLYSGQGTTSVSATTNTIFPVTFTYSAPGSYTAYMIVETSGGCVDTSFMHPITVVTPPNVSLISMPDTVCAGVPVQIGMTASPGPIQHWHVNTDHGFFSGCVNDSTPTFPFSHTGTQTVSLHAYRDGCEGESVLTQNIVVKGPMGKARVRGCCQAGSRKTIEAVVHLQEAESASVNFGDNTFPVNINGNATGSSSHTLTHTYAASGNYTLTVTSLNSLSGCGPHTFTTPVIIRDIKPILTSNNISLAGKDTFAVACAGSKVIIDASQTGDVMASCSRGYLWMLSTPGYTFPSHDTLAAFYVNDTLVAGKVYELVLRVKDENECVEYDTVHFRLSSAIPDFSINPNPICLSSGTVQFTNLSQPKQHPDDQITTSSWNFGDLTQYTTNNQFENPIHTYSSASTPFQEFYVILTVTNNLGCTGSVQKKLQVNNPVVNLQASNWFPCLPKGGQTTLTLTASQGYATYSVNPGLPGGQWSTITQNSLPISYSSPGDKTVTILVIDNAGCRNSDTKIISVIGQPTAVIVFAENSNKYCVPATPTVISNSLENISVITNTIWTIGQISTPAPGSGTLNYIFSSVGIQTLALTVDVDGHCPSKAIAKVVIADPKAQAHIQDNKICLGDTINVSLRDTNSVSGWKWFFGDFVTQQDIHAGSIFAIFNPTLSYPYTIKPGSPDGKTVVGLRYYGTEGACPRTSTLELQVIHLLATFKSEGDIYAHCLDDPDSFQAQAENPWQLSLDYNWDFGNGGSGFGETVSHTYDAPGTYSIELLVKDRHEGCRDTSLRVVTVYPLPQGSLTVNKEMICPGDTFQLAGTGTPGVSGAVTGTLVPAQSFSFNGSNQFTLSTVAALTSTYALTVSDNNNCISKPSFAVINVLEKPMAIHWDTSVVIGQTVQLNALMGSNFTYSWGPVVSDLSCDNCYNPVSTSTLDITYSVTVTDQPMQCYNTTNTYRIIIRPVVSIDVPTAFTPNGDGVNDYIFPDGWAHKKLIYFRVYNRWGQLIFETNVLKKGWDGTFNGEPQNVETYIYQAAVETLTNEVLTKSGSFKLLR